MGQSLLYTTYPTIENYTEIIDVRSEQEFTEDCIPGAINLPVLNNEERARVGTIYKQVSPFEAKKIGASIISRNISSHINDHFLNKDKSYFPLIYCWRGGQRSASLALVLNQIGWRVNLLKGGYKTYRNYVRQKLEAFPLQFNYCVLSGLTGTSKTRILRHLAQQKIQVLDLEALANHRGSLLGLEWHNKPSPQPTQKWFDSLLLQKLQSFDRDLPVWVESESNKIGQVHLPNSLRQAMKQARVIRLNLPLTERVKLLLAEYPHLIQNPQFLKQQISKLKPRYGNKKIQAWYQLIDDKQWQNFVSDILIFHYDPAYQRSLIKDYQHIVATINLQNLSEVSIDRVVAIAVGLNQLSPNK